MKTEPVKWSVLPSGSYETCAKTWDALNVQAGALPFLDSKFLVPLMRHTPLQGGLLALGETGGVAIAAALLEPAGFGRMTTYQPSQLPLGAWMVAQGQDATALAESLMRALPATCLVLGLSQQDPLLWNRPTHTEKLRTLDYIQTGWIDVSGSFDTFWESRGKNLRSNLRKQRSKLAGDGTPVDYVRLTRAEDVARAIIEYGRLESAGWKAEIGTAVSLDSAQGRFYAEMMTAFCAAGQGEIWQLRLGGKIVALDLCITLGSTLVILKTAYDPEYRSLSPAFLLKQDAFKQVFDEGRIKRIEFYGRLMEWHTRWTEESRTLFHANVFRWAWVASLRDRKRQRRTDVAGAAASATPG